MSGGRFNYMNDSACSEIFQCGAHADYGLGKDKYYSQSVEWARWLNPMQDKELSELVFDVFCLLHSLDWYTSGDTGEETYREDVDYFKRKWLVKRGSKKVAEEIDKSLEELRRELNKSLSAYKLRSQKEDAT